MNDSNSEKNYFVKRWFLFSAVMVALFIFMPYALWFFFNSDIEMDGLMTFTKILLIVVTLISPLIFILYLFVWPIAYSVGSSSFQVKYCFTLRKKEYFYKDIQEINYFRLKQSLYPTSTLLIKTGGEYKRIEFVPNQVITYLYPHMEKDKIKEIGIQQLKELKKYNVILSENKEEPKKKERKTFVKNYKLFYFVLLSVGIIIAIIGGILYQVFDYQRVGNLFFIFIGIHMVGISLLVISGLKLLTKNAKFLKFGYY